MDTFFCVDCGLERITGARMLLLARAYRVFYKHGPCSCLPVQRGPHLARRKVKLVGGADVSVLQLPFLTLKGNSELVYVALQQPIEFGAQFLFPPPFRACQHDQPGKHRTGVMSVEGHSSLSGSRAVKQAS